MDTEIHLSDWTDSSRQVNVFIPNYPPQHLCTENVDIYDAKRYSPL
jgi:hypothetical protein